MQVHPLRTRRRAYRVISAVMAAVAALFVLQMSSALGATQSQQWTGQADGPTPDLERTDLQYFLPNGQQGPGGAAGTINLTLDGTPVVAYCIETTKFLNQNTPGPTVEVTEIPLATPADRAVLWILQNRTPTGPITPAKQDDAAISQVAVWVLRGELRATNPTSSATINAAAAARIQEALTESATPRTLALNAAAPAAGATSTTITIAAKPGSEVQLAVTSGPGTLSAPSVTVGPSGTATVTLTAPGPGTTTISGTTAGDGVLYAIQPTSDDSQNTTTSGKGNISATTTVTFTAATTPTTPTTPSAPVAGVTPSVVVAAKAKLGITKTAPKTAKVLTRVKYTIVVSNTSKVTAKNVTLRDTLPSGLSFAKSSRLGTLSTGRISFSLGTLKPGQSRTVSVWLVANASVRGKRTNTATAQATGVAAVRATAATVFAPIAKRIQPAVTG